MICSDDTGKLDVFFLIHMKDILKKILPLNRLVTISGKINFFKGKYQITNPTHVSTDKNKSKKYILIIIYRWNYQIMFLIEP